MSHNNHMRNLIGDIKEDPKPFWRYISSQKSDVQGIPPLETKDNGTAKTDLEKAEALNKQFSSVFTRTEYDSIPMKTPEQKMPDITLTRKGVEKLLLGLNTSKAMGPDKVHPRILKELAHDLSEVMTHFFQQSITIGIIPEEWKQANICPLFKKNDRSVPSNYRPVSLTCILCKVLEHIICSNLMTFFEENNILNPRQHAFRKRHSCETQLINVIDDWAKALDKQKQTDIFILDFEKAFDTVPHELLKSKLHGHGVRKNVLNWIDSFLSDRQQCVVVNGSKSGNEPVASGVPQGTVLGPILFLIHINDISENVSSEIRLFADDCVCYRDITSEEDCQALQKDINTLGDWAEQWGMRFQPVKCNMMTLSKKKKSIHHAYTLKGTELVFLDSIKYLGVNITSSLHWGKHIEEVCAKSYRTLGLLKRNLQACPQEVRLQAYIGLIRPVLEYASSAWDPGQLYLMKKLEDVQKRAARFITSNYHEYHPGSMTAILEDIKLEPLQQRRRKNRLILLCKGLNHQATLPTDQLERPKYRTRDMHSEHFIQLQPNKEVYRHSFMTKTVKDWDELSPDVFSRMQVSEDPVKTFAAVVRGGASR